MLEPGLLPAASRRRQLANRCLDQRLERVRIHHVGGHHERVAAEFADLLCHLLQIRPGPGGQGDVRAGLGQAGGYAPPDALPGTGDDRDPPAEPEPVEDH